MSSQHHVIVISAFIASFKMDELKTSASASGYEVVECDSSHYSWVKDSTGKVKTVNGKMEANRNFVDHYKAAINSAIVKAKGRNKNTIIVVSTHAPIRSFYSTQSGVPYAVVYPNNSVRKDQWTERMKTLGLDRQVATFNEKWDQFIKECNDTPENASSVHCTLTAKEYLSGGKIVAIAKKLRLATA